MKKFIIGIYLRSCFAHTEGRTGSMQIPPELILLVFQLQEIQAGDVWYHSRLVPILSDVLFDVAMAVPISYCKNEERWTVATSN